MTIRELSGICVIEKTRTGFEVELVGKIEGTDVKEVIGVFTKRLLDAHCWKSE